MMAHPVCSYGKRRLLSRYSALFMLVLLLFSALAYAVSGVPDGEGAGEGEDAGGEGSSRFRFVVVGDTHIGCGDRGVHPRIGDAVERIIGISPAFVIQLGDLISIRDEEQSNSAECIDTMWQRAAEEVVNPITQAGILFFFTTGNHDGALPGNYGSQVSLLKHDRFWSSHPSRNRDYPVSGVGYHRYYSFDYGDSHFVSLFAPGTHGLRDSQEQFAWLREDLSAASGSTHIFAFSHTPLRRPATAQPNNRPAGPLLQQATQLMSLMKSAGVKIHFGGHVHIPLEVDVEGIKGIIPGVLGGGRGTPADTGVTPGWAFMVVDVDGDDIQYYRLEAPDFNNPDMPDSPEVTSPMQTPELPSGLEGVGVCPPGMRPAPAGTVGGISSRLGCGAVSILSPPDSIDGSTVLQHARQYEGRRYGTGPCEFVCSSFVTQIIRDLGVDVDSEMERRINVAVGGRGADAIIAENDPIHKGVQYALTSAGVGDAVSVGDAQPGDFVQYWWREDGSWRGHSAIIEEVKGDGRFDIYGAHWTRVTSSDDVDLGDPDKLVYIARLHPDAGSGSEGGVAVVPQVSPSSPAPATGAAPSTASQPVSSSSSSAGCGGKVALVGDSLTACSSNYIRYLREMCGEGTTIMNEDSEPGTVCTSQVQGRFCLQPGERGDKFAYVCKTTRQMKDDFDAVLAWEPDTIVLIGGGNDIGRDWQTVRSNLLDMYNRARAQGIRVVAGTITPQKTADELGPALDTLKRINEWILSESPADVKVDLYPEFVLPGTDDINPALFGGDRIHPNPAGKQRMAQKIHDALTGAAPSAGPTGPAAPSVGSGTSTSQGGGTVCVPESVLPSTLFDFLMNSTLGVTGIAGISRQNIAVGINKTASQLTPGAVCVPISADREYDLDFLKGMYGRNRLQVEAQLQDFSFMGKDVSMHRKIVPALACVEQDIMRCDEGSDYWYRTVGSYRWQALAEDPELLATSSFGISLDINLDSNLNNQEGELQSDIPQCVVDAFRRYGFRWGGDYETAKCPAHFEFMADPGRVAILSAEVAGEIAEEGAAAAGDHTPATGGVNVLVCVSEGHGAATFRAAANSIQSKIGGELHFAGNAREMLDAIRQHDDIRNLILLGHGTSRGFLRPGATGARVGRDALPRWVSVETLAAEIAPRLNQGSIVGLAACSTGSDPAESGWDPPIFGPGGENGFAAKLRDALSQQQGIPSGIQVRAHTTAGHTTANPAVRMFPVGASYVGTQGVSVLDSVWGGGAHMTLSREWISKFRGEPSEDWMAGGAAVVV